MDLTSQNVEKVFFNCLFKEGENTNNPVIANGIMAKVGFHEERLNNNSDNIISMLNKLPKDFQKDSGGGMSFLNACDDYNGNQWTSLHKIMEQLFMLGLALGKVKCLMPRDMWKMLPGGMPYYVIN